MQDEQRDPLLAHVPKNLALPHDILHANQYIFPQRIADTSSQETQIKRTLSKKRIKSKSPNKHRSNSPGKKLKGDTSK